MLEGNQKLRPQLLIFLMACMSVFVLQQWEIVLWYQLTTALQHRCTMYEPGDLPLSAHVPDLDSRLGDSKHHAKAKCQPSTWNLAKLFAIHQLHVC